MLKGQEVGVKGTILILKGQEVDFKGSGRDGRLRGGQKGRGSTLQSNGF